MNWNYGENTGNEIAEDEELHATWSIELPEVERQHLVSLWLIVSHPPDIQHEIRVGNFANATTAKSWIEKVGREHYKKMWEEE